MGYCKRYKLEPTNYIRKNYQGELEQFWKCDIDDRFSGNKDDTESTWVDWEIFQGKDLGYGEWRSITVGGLR